MAIIECNYFNKNGNPMKNLGNLSLTVSDFAHSLLSLHVRFGSSWNKSFRYIAYLLQVLSDFRIQSGNLVMNNLPEDAYDGIKKMSDIYGAALTVLIAQKKYGHKLVIPLKDSSVFSSTGERPDFLATDGVHYSLFESKASIDYVATQAKEKGIVQLNSVSSVNYGPNVVNTFNEKVLVSTNFRNRVRTSRRQKIICNIYDPDFKGDNEIALNLDNSFLGYYDFVKEIIGFPSEEMRFGLFGSHIVAKVIQIGDVRIKIGMLTSLYDFNRNNQGKPTSRILDLLESEVDNNVDHLFGDGIYLKIEGVEW